MTASRPIVMPKLGLTMTEGLLAEWKVSPGDAFKAGDVIFVVETDKISNEVEASDNGVIGALLVEAGETVPVGTPLATLASDARQYGGTGHAEPGGEPSRPAEKPLQQPAAAPARRAADASPRVIATPLARRMAAGAELDLASVTGSGPRGRIMADDVATAIAGCAPALADAGAAPPATGTIPLGPYQKVTARRLTESKRDIPHFYVFAEADVTDLAALRRGLNADHGEPKLTVSHFLVAAMARALAAVPEMNRVWQSGGLLQMAHVDIGLAIESPRGLVAPVLRDLASATLDDIAWATAALIERARAGRLSADELAGGVASISNVGMFGATGLLPIINPGQSSILGVGRAQGLFRPDARGQPALRQILNLALSCDHRVVDGALAARFLQVVQNGLEAPHALLRRPSQGTIP